MEWWIKKAIKDLVTKTIRKPLTLKLNNWYPTYFSNKEWLSTK